MNIMREKHKLAFLPVSTLSLFFLEQKELLLHYDTGAQDLGVLRAVLGVTSVFPLPWPRTV